LADARQRYDERGEGIQSVGNGQRCRQGPGDPNAGEAAVGPGLIRAQRGDDPPVCRPQQGGSSARHLVDHRGQLVQLSRSSSPETACIQAPPEYSSSVVDSLAVSAAGPCTSKDSPDSYLGRRVYPW